MSEETLSFLRKKTTTGASLEKPLLGNGRLEKPYDPSAEPKVFPVVEPRKPLEWVAKNPVRERVFLGS
ncbi:hypothetical protein MPNT_50156 [Candidatus Methylacidithermus pantelleriae]|uniref:Uncharacterized protein n=1 Tax=Candidatus Methylacidithermus pantelleriae TaxID=2744239 RepID=A0A8J2FT58_9BACT|nr:hypothetical protein MPNT_50156 [Candidatus Methylacidithermus pantelleriae]